MGRDGLGEVRAQGGTVADRLDDQWVGVRDDNDAEAIVKVDVFVAVDVPDTAAFAVVDEDRLGRGVLEGRGHAARDELLRLLPELVGPMASGTKPLLFPGDQFHDPLGGDRLRNRAHTLPPRAFFPARAEIPSIIRPSPFSPSATPSTYHPPTPHPPL